MTKSKTGKQRADYSPEFRQQALLRAATEGVPTVARDLGLQPAQLYAWRSKAQRQGHYDEAHRLEQAERAQLKREIARLEEENAFLKNRLPGAPRPIGLETRPLH
ncbi:transposase [Pseudomonas aeruginosa]|uniref:transposase n=1 Tax=Pseudomonas aeruginosa TaxID=287 RepID=UPI0018C6D4F1|nr:transposase [Pseudomonas aeruginosa]EKV8015549.1 transposase [Pseudomonas aeruginosa]EKX2802089.1 transposase [Pseudomonas aeruginosa]MBG5798883.1 transposase [Pseudomonas aeruginosa]MBP8320000.1 transposase [Pseudomonas aeruginosa]MBP8351730.1 transposase [Pseudomonas aeruginosa]